MKTKNIEEIVDIYCERYPHLSELAQECKEQSDYHNFKVAVIQLATPKGITMADLWELTSH